MNSSVIREISHSRAWLTDDNKLQREPHEVCRTDDVQIV